MPVAITVVPVLVYLVIPESPRWHLRRGHPQAAADIVNRIIRDRVPPLTVAALGDPFEAAKEGKGAIKWTRLSCRTFAANAVRVQLHALAYNLGNFLRTLALPKAAEPWSLTSLREKLIKIGAKVVSYGRYVIFQLGEGRGVAADVCRYPVADRPAAGAARPVWPRDQARCDRADDGRGAP